MCGREEFQTAFEKQLLKSPGGKRKLGIFRDLQAVYGMRGRDWEGI